MKVKRIFALLTALAMVFGIVPTLALADGVNLPLTLSYISTSASTGEYTLDDHSTRPYAISWANTDGYRMGVIVFDASDIDKSIVGKATLDMTVYRTQNINENSSVSTVTVYALDPAKADKTNPEALTYGKKVGVISLSGVADQKRDLTSPVSAELDLGNYFTAYPDATEIALVLTNRDDEAECNSRGLVGFYGSESESYAPTLTLANSTDVTVKLVVGGEAVASYVKNLNIGSSYTPDDAPEYIVYNGKAYTRDAVSAVKVEENTEVSVSYSEGVELSDVVIEGDDPVLPAQIAVVSGGDFKYEPLNWTSSGGKYTATVSGCSLTGDVKVLSCDNSVETFYSAGNSAGASFVYYNSLGYEYGGGEVVFETDFIVNDGTNKLISYGNGSTDAFNSTAVPMRYMNTTDSDGNYVFEYYNSDWKQSSVVCEAGERYRLRTVLDFATKKYDMYIAGSDGVYKTITEGSAFRGSLDSVDRMFVHGSGEAGELEGVILSHRSHWESGYTNLTVNYVDEDGNPLADAHKTKYATGATYTASDAPKAIIKDGVTYVLDDVTAAPSVEISGTEQTFDIEYHKSVSLTTDDIADVNTVVGDALSMPSTVTVVFDNGQSLKYGVTWDTSAVNTAQAGEYTASGTLSAIPGLNVSCRVIVKEVTTLPYEDNVTVATNNGGWNWYVEPSGTHIQPGDDLANRYQEYTVKEDGSINYTYSSNNGYVFKHDRTYMGWVEDSGNIVVAQLDHDTGEYTRVVIHKMLESDDHNNPAVVILPDGRIMAWYSMHTNEPYMYYRVSKYPEDITEWNDEQYYYCQTKTSSETNTYNATYPTVFMVHDDEGKDDNDVIYVGWRGVHWKPTLAKFSMPDDSGVCTVVMGQTQFANTTYGYSTYSSGTDAPNAYTDGGLTDSGRRPYTKYDYDPVRNKIYITFTANHPDNDKINHVFYLYLNVEDQGLYTAKDNYLQPLPVENNSSYSSKGADGTSGQWGVVTYKLYEKYPELVVFNASELTNDSFNPRYASAERRGWTWDISHNEAGEPCIVYVDITATPPADNGGLPTWYLSPASINDNPYSDTNSRSHHYYWYARWDSETQEWVNTYLTYGGKWFHENATQERCYSGGLTFDHNASDANVIYLSVPTMGEYGNVFEIYRWESDDHGATWTVREPITQNSPTNNARPNAIYNYKQDDETGENLGPRLLWISGEYRYWMNYEYKTGVKTDYKADGFITQDDPEMFADTVLLDAGGNELEALPTGENVELQARFTITNISIGDGTVKLALAHYGADNELKGVKITDDITIPARSVPQIGMIGAPKTEDGGRSTLGDPEVVETVNYTAEKIEEGDRIALFAWDDGIEYSMKSISSIPYEISTSGSKYLFSEDFSYDGTEKLLLDENEETFNGWVAKAYNRYHSSAAFGPSNYVAITKAPFGNTALHLYGLANDTDDTGHGSIMVSHKLPDTNGEDYTIEFTMRSINEMSWNSIDNVGFTLSNGIPSGYNDSSNSSSAFQLRQRVKWDGTNGRGTYLRVRNTRAFDGGSETNIVRKVNDDNRLWKDSSVYTAVTDGYFDSDAGTYLHFSSDPLMTGSLYHIWVTVRPSLYQIELAIDDGYRTATYTSFYNDYSSYDWDANPIDTITFSVGLDNDLLEGRNDETVHQLWGELYIDDFLVYNANTDGAIIRTAAVQTADTGADLLDCAEWTIIPINGSYVFLNGEGLSLDVNSQGTAVGTKVSTYAYNGGDNQIFYLDEADGGYYIRGKQSGLYLGVADDGSVTLQELKNAALFTITDTAEEQTVNLDEFFAELTAE